MLFRSITTAAEVAWLVCDATGAGEVCGEVTAEEPPYMGMAGVLWAGVSMKDSKLPGAVEEGTTTADVSGEDSWPGTIGCEAEKEDDAGVDAVPNDV